MSTRTYHSPLRQAHAEATRNVVLDAAIDVLVDDGADGLSQRAIARRAGVSAPTVARHFPTHEALLDALDKRISERIGIPRGPRDADELLGAISNVYRGMEAESRIVTAYLRAPASRAVGQRRRREWITSAFGPLVAHLPEDDRRKVLAMLQLGYSTRTWEHLREVWDLRGDDAAHAVAWMVRALIDAIHERPPSAVPMPEPMVFERDDEEAP